MANRIQGNKRSSILSKGRTSFSLSPSSVREHGLASFIYSLASPPRVKLNWPGGRQEHLEPRRERNETANIVKDFVRLRARFVRHFHFNTFDVNHSEGSEGLG